MKQEPCFLCGRPCTVGEDFHFSRTFYKCFSCGNYCLNRKTKINFEDCIRERRMASYLTAERHLHGKSGIVLGETDDATMEMNHEIWPCFTMETFLKSYPKDSIEIIDRTLLNFAQLNDFPGKPFEINRVRSGENMVPERLITFCSEWSDFVNIVLLLERTGFVEIASVLKNTTTNQVVTGVERYFAVNQFELMPLLLLPKGLQRIRELKSKAAGDQAQAFVAMWFDQSRNKYFDIIEKAAIDAGFNKCLRIDNKEHNNKICDEIIAEIRKSQCLIADFTGNRGGVYFEAGFALGLGIPVIWLVDKNWWNETDEHGNRKNDLHFDTRQYAHIDYSNEDELYERLKARITATISIRQ